MKITEQDVQHVADLANLELTPGERQRYIKDLNSILEYVGMLNEVDTAEVEPFSTQNKGAGMPLREDQPRPGVAHDRALMNAPETDGIFFQVPKVIDKAGDAKK